MHGRSCLAVAAVALVLCGCGPRLLPADVVFTNGNIYTLAGDPPARVEDEPRFEALAVRAGRIVALGSRDAVEKLVGDSTRVHDLRGRTLVPGLVDSHAHVQSLGRSLRQVDLVGTQSFDEVIERVRARAADLAAGEWVLGRGWDQNDWPTPEFPDHAALSAALPQQPVFLRRVDGHAALVNAAAMAIASIGPSGPDPSGGRILRRAGGAPTGVLVDRAMDLVTPFIPPPSAVERQLRLQVALTHASEKGLTGVHDAGIDGFDLEDYRTLLERGALPLRVYAMIGATARGDVAADSLLQLALRDGPHPFEANGRFALRSVKLMVDGALGSRGAALLEPYSDEPAVRGLPQYDLEEFLTVARPLHAAGFQLATHAIGDAGNRLVLDAYEVLQRETPRADSRHRIEHAQVLAPEDIPRFATLGVLPSMQPTHCTSDMPWAGARLGAARERGAYAWRALRDTGVLLPGGSDAPVESIDPLLGLYAAVTRQDVHGKPAAGWHSEERLTRSEALRAFTSWAAHASFTESELGTLELGKRADLTVVDRDVLRCPAPELLSTRVTMTVVDGDVVFRRD